jgi:maltokinase
MSSLAAYAIPEAYPALAALLRDWLPQQRWFAGKARTLSDLTVVDVAVLDERVIDVFVDVRYEDGRSERYQAPLAAAPHEVPDDVGLVGRAEGLVILDATADAAACRLLAEATLDTRVVRSTGGDALVGRPLAELRLEHEDEPRRVTGEQSNTSVLFGNRWFFKLFRRLESGVNPDVEITRALTLAGFAHTPAQQGAWELERDDGSGMTLAVLADYVEGGRDGWELAVEEARRIAGGEPMQGGLLLDTLPALGRAVGTLHVTLREAFGSRAADPADAEQWAAAMAKQVDEVFTTAADRAPDVSAALLARREEVLDRLTAVANVTDAGELVRTHGDLHLGQVLLDASDDWQVLDFEGEPARPLEERRVPHAPLRDVAGMLRSFDYAAGHAAVEAEVPPAVAAWRDAAHDRFLEGYLDVVRSTGILPRDPDAVAALLDAFELDKAVYELGYELANRPAWVRIPVAGILRVLDAASAGRSEARPRKEQE